MPYEDGAAAIDWLTGAFGFRERLRFQDSIGMTAMPQGYPQPQCASTSSATPRPRPESRTS